MGNKNKSILITGASGSIGLAISKKIIANGYDAVMCYNKNDSFIDDIKNYAKDYNVNIRFLKIYCDCIRIVKYGSGPFQTRVLIHPFVIYFNA